VVERVVVGLGAVGMGEVVVELEPAVVVVESLDDEALSDPEPHAAAPRINRTATDRHALAFLMGRGYWRGSWLRGIDVQLCMSKWAKM
jgi:hypothetical protein